MPDAIPSSTTTLSFPSSTAAPLSGTPAASKTSSTSTGSSSRQSLGARQVSNSVLSSTSTSASSLGEILPSVSTVPDTSNEPLISIGPFVCTTTINLSTFTSQLQDYIQKTESLLGANLLYVVINIHAAAATRSPSSPAPAPSNLPGPSNYLGNLFSGNLSAYIYSESNLRSERTNINSSWYTVNELFRPVADYYPIELGDYGIASTDDGWPGESFVEFSKSKRLLLQWGTVDPQMANYNFTGDSGIIFPTSYIQDVQTDINATSDGNITRGCYLRNATDNLSISNVNTSVIVTFSFCLSFCFCHHRLKVRILTFTVGCQYKSS